MLTLRDNCLKIGLRRTIDRLLTQSLSLGPFFVTIGRRHEKRRVALFTCLTVRAIPLELAEDLSSDACIIGNFVNRRGVLNTIRSDMGTNVVGVDNILKKTNDRFE